MDQVMAVYEVKNKGYRYDFTSNKERYSSGIFKTKREANHAESLKRIELNKIQDGTFYQDVYLEDLFNSRLDYLLENDYTTHYYNDTRSMANRCLKAFGNIPCSQITEEMVKKFLRSRSKKTKRGSNYDRALLQKAFNHGIEEKLCKNNPVRETKKCKYRKKDKFIPTSAQLNEVIKEATPEQQDYLLTLQHTVGRMSEINNLTWKDVNLPERKITLYTRKKEDRELTPRTIYISDTLLEVLIRRYENRKPEIPWVFYHRYWSRKLNKFVIGPYQDRKKFMKTLCAKAGIEYFRFHPIRHCSASTLADANVQLVDIQVILGHERITATDFYMKNLKKDTKEAVDA